MISLSILLAAAGISKAAATIGAGIAVVGAAFGIGRIGSSALDAMARQPEKMSGLQSAMVLAAALIEGATFFALVICIIAVFV